MGEASEDGAALDALMGRLADGDRAAFDPLFRALHPRAVRLARLRLGEADALDAAQSALERVFSRASEFTPGRPALPWFYAIAANEVHAVARRLKAAAARSDTSAGDALVAAGDPEDDLVRAELRAALASGIDALEPAHAGAIASLLGDGEGDADRDAAPLRPAARRKRLSRAYAQLRRLLVRFHEH